MVDTLLKHALIARVLEGDGPLVLQRHLQQLRTEMPGLSAQELVERLVDPALATRGEALAEQLKQRHIKWVTLLDEGYPLTLKQIADPPLLLFYSGALQAVHRPCISIVGSRRCSTYGAQVAHQLAGELAALGFVIVSGLALGVDTRAHNACLQTDGRTAAVLGSGIDTIYPASNRGLGREIIRKGGAILSEFPPGTPIKPFHFPYRNRIISGLSHATLVVEATEKSGSLITARHCLDQGRELFAVPGPIHKETSKGTNGLIARGEARLLFTVETLLQELRPLLGMAAAHEDRMRVEIKDPLAKKIYERLDAFEPMPLDLLIADLGLDTGTVTAKLVELESLNMVECQPGLNYLRNPLTPTVPPVSPSP